MDMMHKDFDPQVVRDFRRINDLTQLELSGMLGVHRTYLAMIETGNKTPSHRLQRIIHDTIANYTHQSRKGGRRDSGYGMPRSRDIPVVSWAAAGKATDYQDLANQLDEMVGTSIADPNAFAIIIEGDSMEPTFRAGDRVVLAPNLEPRNGDAVLAKLNDGRVFFKSFLRTGDEGKIVRLNSENPHYKPMEYGWKDIAFIYPALEFKRSLRR